MSLPSIASPLSLPSLKRTRPDQPLRLLVSVRDAEEAGVALSAGVDVIDVKEPARGALGRADDDTLGQIAEAVRGRTLLSFAAGEAIDSADDAALGGDFVRGDHAGYSLFKYGPAGLGRRDDWREILIRVWRSTKGAASPIAVAYVDYAAADAPAPEEIVQLAIDRGCAGILFDTYGKAPRLGLTALFETRLRSCIARAREAGLLVALAGSLGADDVADVRRFGADLFAVRGAACTGGRAGRIDGARIAALKEAIAHDAASAPEFDAEANEAILEGRASRGGRTSEFDDA
jgi:uncharacterized protein (UPF0264 family)